MKATFALHRRAPRSSPRSQKSTNSLRSALTVGAAVLLACGGARAETFTLEEATIDQIQKAMADGALSSVELTGMYLNRLNTYDRAGLRINSTPVISSSALFAAAEADALRGNGVVLGAMHGVPYSVKDTFAVKGEVATNGQQALLGLTATQDAFFVNQLRTSGGVFLGMTNMIVAGFGITSSESESYGITLNPYTLNSAAGSSCGSGAAAGGNFTGFAVGVENSGSIRFPAAVHGLVGVKPTRGLVSNSGGTGIDVPEFTFTGPLARTVRDAAEALEIMSRYDVQSDVEFALPPYAERRPASYLPSLQTGALRGKKLGIPAGFSPGSSNATVDFQPGVVASFAKVKAELEALGATIVEVNLEKVENSPSYGNYGDPDLVALGMPAGYGDFSEARNDYYSNLVHTWDVYFQRYTDGVKFRTFEDFVADEIYFRTESDGPIAELGFASTLDYVQFIRAQGWDVALKDQPRTVSAITALNEFSDVYLTQKLDELGVDALVFPTYGVELWSFDVFDVSPDSAYLGDFLTWLNSPLVTMSMPFLDGTEGGKRYPQTFIFAGRPFDEAKLLSFAYDYEQATKHREASTLTPPLPGETIEYTIALPPPSRPELSAPALRVAGGAKVTGKGKKAALVINGGARDASGLSSLKVYVNGKKIAAKRAANWKASVKLSALRKFVRGDAKTVSVQVVAKDIYGNTSVTNKNVKLPKDA